MRGCTDCFISIVIQLLNKGRLYILQELSTGLKIMYRLELLLLNASIG